MIFDSNTMADPFAVVKGVLNPDPKSANAQAGIGQVVNTGQEVQAPIATNAVVKAPLGGLLTKRNIVIAAVVGSIIWYVWKRSGPIAVIKKAAAAVT